MRDRPRLAELGLGPLLTLGQARAVGVTAKQLSRATATDAVRRLTTGLYVVPSAWDRCRPEEQQRHLGAWALALRPHGVLSHHTAAALYGLPLPPTPIAYACLTVPRGGTANGPKPVRLEPGRLDPHQQRELDGLVVTSPARTVVDCLRTMSLPDAVAITDAALARGLVSYPELERERYAQRRWPGVSKVDLGLWLSDPARESWLESSSFVTLWRHGVALPEHQTVVFDASGRFVARVDGLWREAGVVGEADGVGKYLGPPDEPASVEIAERELAEESRRQQELEALGLVVVRWGLAVPHDERRERVQAAMRSATPHLVTARYEVSPRGRHAWRGAVVQPPLEKRNRLRPSR